MYHEIASNKRRSVVCVVLFVAVWVGIGALIGLAYASATRVPHAGSNATGAIVAGMAVAAVVALLATAYSLSSGTRLVLRVAGAQPADPARFTRLHDVVEALAIGEGIPKPEVYVIQDPSPNAFATGTSPGRAAVTVTSGLLDTMNREELEGVVAHELSHIRNYDVRLLLILGTLVGLAGLLASLVWRGAVVMRPRGRNGGQVVLVTLAAGILLGAVALVFGPLIRLALSRRREELADVSAVELTRNPAGLISALHKLEANDRPFANFNHATAPMCIDDPLQHHSSWIHRLFDTHPPISERIAVLERIATGELV